MTMENQPVEDVSPIKNGHVFHCHVSLPKGNLYATKKNSWFQIAMIAENMAEISSRHPRSCSHTRILEVFKEPSLTRSLRMSKDPT